MTTTDPRERLIADLGRERAGFLAALAAIEPGSLTTPGLIGEWSAREIVAHLGYWAGHAAESIHAVQAGHADEFGADRPPVDEVNATVARVATTTPLTTVLKREAASVEAFVDLLRGIDPGLLDAALPHHGLSLEAGLREDGPDHYREHAEELQRVLTERPHG